MDQRFAQVYEQMDQRFAQVYEQMDQWFTQVHEQMDQNFALVRSDVGALQKDVTILREGMQIILQKLR
jgi:archaellum component FlaF (FlaF/FlaG flagellin family)